MREGERESGLPRTLPSCTSPHREVRHGSLLRSCSRTTYQSRLSGAGEEDGEKDGARHQENGLEHVHQAHGRKYEGGEKKAGLLHEEVRIAGVGDEGGS